MKIITSLLLAVFLSVSVFGQDWEECVLPDNEGAIYDMTEHNGDFYLATFSGVYKSTNNGQDWIRIFNDENIKIYYLAFTNNTLIGGGNGIYRSYDYGESWMKMFTPDLEVYSISTSGDEVLIGTNNKIYFSNNNGESWSPRTSTPFDSYWINGMLKIAENTYLAQTTAGCIYKSDDNMQHWSLPISITNYKKESSLPKSPGLGYHFVKVSNGNIFLYRNYNSGSERILMSTNNASDFTYISLVESNNQSETTSMTEYNGKLYALRFDGDDNNDAELYASDDFGLNWYIINELTEFDSTDKWPRMLKVYNGHAFISTGEDKLYRFTLPPSKVNKLQDNNLILNCVPNPTKDIVRIKYQIKQDANVRLSVTDVTGKDVLVVVNARQQEGDYNYKVNISNLNKGIYMCRLQIDDKYIVKKMIVL